MDKIDYASVDFDKLEPFDDEIDAAILSDENMEQALGEGAVDMDIACGEEDSIDVNQEYDMDAADADEVSLDAEAMIAAERDLMKNPFDEDDEIDAAIGDDTPETLELEDEGIDVDDVSMSDLVDD